MAGRSPPRDRPSWVGPREWAGQRDFVATAQDDVDLLLQAGWRCQRPSPDGGPPAPAVLERDWAPRLRQTIDRPVAPAACAGLARAFPADRCVLTGPGLAAWERHLAERVS